MDKTFKIKIIRESDSSEFYIGDDSDWKLLKKGLDGFAEINNTLSYTDNAIRDGGYITAEHITKTDRTIKFCYIYPQYNDIARKRLRTFFNVHDSYRVYVTHGNTTVWATGKIYKLKMNMSSDVTDWIEASVTFLFADPYWKSYDEFGKNIAGLTGMIAFPYICANDTSPAPQGQTGGLFNFAQQVTLYNDGDVQTECEIEIACSGGDVENPKIIINDEYVRIIDDMAAGDKIVMDFSAFPPTVKKNGENYLGHCDRTSAFDGMILAQGDNIIQYDADNGSSHMNVTVYYYKKYGVI